MKIRVISLMFTLFIIIGICSGCKSNDLAEVYTKVSDKEITFFSQDSQYITIEIKVLDGEKELRFEKELMIRENKSKKLKLQEITDNTFLDSKAKIIDVSIQKRTDVPESTVLSNVFIISVAVIWLILVFLCLFFKKRQDIIE